MSAKSPIAHSLIKKRLFVIVIIGPFRHIWISYNLLLLKRSWSRGEDGGISQNLPRKQKPKVAPIADTVRASRL